MTPGEFKAWFDGFTEAFSGCPTKAQWARIKARVAEIDGKPVTERVYVDRYWPTYQRYVIPAGPFWTTYCGASSGGAGGGAGGAGGAAVGMAATNTVALNAANIGSHGNTFNSGQAMTALGRAEARSLAA